ncbi:MAG TPA: ABC transporter ATP-binding protein, partial [Alphaproteobacteria bacterium]
MLNVLKKLPVLGAFVTFLKSPTGRIFRSNLHQQRWLMGLLLVFGNSMAAITSARVLLGVIFMQVITGGDMSIVPAHWLQPDFLSHLPIIGDYKYGPIVLIACVMVSLSLLNFGLEYLQKVFTSVLDVRFAANLRRFTTDYTLTCDASFFAGNKLGEISYIFSGFATAVSNILNFSQSSVVCILRICMVLGVIFFLDPVLTIAIMVAAACLWPIMTYMQRRMHRIADQRRTFDMKANGLFADILYAIRLVKQSNQQDRLKSEFYGFMSDRDERQVAYVKATALANALTQIFGMVTVMSVALTVFILKEVNIFNNIGFLLGYIAGVSRFFAEVTILVNYYTAIGQEIPHLNAMNKLLEDPKIQESYYFRGTKKDYSMDHLSVRHCSYAYDPSVPVLKDISFEAKAGTVTAILGLSGSGKSTLFELIAGYRAAADGAIMLGDTALSD